MQSCLPKSLFNLTTVTEVQTCMMHGDTILRHGFDFLIKEGVQLLTGISCAPDRLTSSQRPKGRVCWQLGLQHIPCKFCQQLPCRLVLARSNVAIPLRVGQNTSTGAWSLCLFKIPKSSLSIFGAKTKSFGASNPMGGTRLSLTGRYSSPNCCQLGSQNDVQQRLWPSAYPQQSSQSLRGRRSHQSTLRRRRYLGPRCQSRCDAHTEADTATNRVRWPGYFILETTTSSVAPRSS